MRYIQMVCVRCPNRYIGQKNSKYCVDCKVDMFKEHRRRRNLKVAWKRELGEVTEEELVTA